ncbi:glycosyltransferase family 4 protein [Streptomyces sp. NPDC052107]|uniref:glycosyltransferase family 4 protein n=1 Tax=Streptomyces sp. NPDC052107 TaxID=3155632 RepID=UPI003417EF8B
MSTTGSRPRVVVVQPYVPGYRTSFFNHLQAYLDASGVVLEVLHGPAPPQQAARRDASSCVCSVQVASRRLPAPGGRSLFWNQVLSRAASADAVVLEQALHNLEAYPLLAKQLAGRVTGRGPLVAFWGHGRTYTKPVSRLEARAKDAVTRLGRWFFAYTEGGAAHVVSRGFPRDRITVVRNSVDTTEMTAAHARAMRPGTAEFTEAALLCERYGLVAGRTALYLGGLDAPKRIPFLLECADRIAAELTGFRLLVAGDGAERHLVDKAASRPGNPVIPMGHVDGPRAALLGAVSDVMLMPGRVGLCAVDSFVLRTPIVTTNWPWHAPEFEYLIDGSNAVVTPDSPATCAAAVTGLLRDPKRLKQLAKACERDAVQYTTEAMARRFHDGVLRVLNHGRS